MINVSNTNITTPLKILNFATFLQYQRFVMPISFLFYLYNGLSFSDFILFQSIFNITCLLSKIPMGVLGDLFSRKALLILSYFLFMLRVILWIFFNGFFIVLAGEILYGLFKGLYRGNVDSYMYDWLKHNNTEDKILSGYGKLSFWTSMGSAVSCIIGALLYKFYGFRFILYIELALQIIAISLLFFLPNIEPAKKEKKDTENLKSFVNGITDLIKKSEINYYIYYSAFLTGLTSIFVWNFQPLLKMSAAPVLLFGIVSFINQLLRGMGGLFVKNITSKINAKTFFKTEYIAVILSFILIITAYKTTNYCQVFTLILGVCIGIFMFVAFNIYTVSKVHSFAEDTYRSTSSSSNTFLGDFASFLFLLIFKYIYDFCDIETTLIIYLITFAILMFPKEKILNKLV